MAIKLTSLHSTLGAELRGVDLTRPVTHEVFAKIDAAFNRSSSLQPALRAARGQSELRECRLVGRPGRLDDGSGANPVERGFSRVAAIR